MDIFGDFHIIVKLIALKFNIQKGHPKYYILLLLWLVISHTLPAQKNKGGINIVPVDSGYAGNSVNAVVFRKNSLVTFRDTQFISFYNQQGAVMIGKRRSGENKWQLKRTRYKGSTSDAHNMISLMVDGAGYLHIAWDHHNNPLNYCRSTQPGSLELTEKMSMTGQSENRVSYPEFYKMPGGDLLFFYRDGGSGNGNLVINRYDIKIKKWAQLQNNLIDGEGQRNAYWQACVDQKGTIHVSWVWRESPDVASNHDMCYARSTDGGKTWQKSGGEKYKLPINATTAEYAFRIPQKSELINQTSMFADANGHPYIATYWRDSGTTVPQYHIVFKKGNQWQMQNLGFLKTAFSLSGGGTKRIPISRPQIVAWPSGKTLSVAVIFRAADRGDKVSVATSLDINKGIWQVKDLNQESVGSWEPTYDTELWKDKRILSLFVQKVVQLDAEGKASVPQEMVRVLESGLSGL